MNKELMREVLAQVTSHPEEWSQSTWGKKTECGTTFCIAGWACILSGWKPAELASGPYPIGSGIDLVEKDGVTRHIEILGAELLELDSNQAEALFYETDNEDAWEMLKEWSA
jgi:hypothetical protein